MSIPGRYKPTPHGYQTFAPDPLPPQHQLSKASQKIAEEATHFLGKVEMCRTLLPNADLLIYSSLQREALASSTIEGTIASPNQLLLFQVSEQAETESVREVANYRMALEWGIEQIQTRSLAARLLLELHQFLLHEVRGASAVGRFKDRQNYIGASPWEPIDRALFIPPSPDDTLPLITNLERYLNFDNDEPRVVQCAYAHYQFETIHPFNDGNGRVGRLLIVLHLMQLRLLSAPLIYPSVYFERTRQQYYATLQSVRDSGTWDAWVQYFCRGIVEQCQETIAFTHLILHLRVSLQEQIPSVRRRASLTAVLDAFFRSPVLSSRQLSDFTGMAVNTVQSVLDDLQQTGMVYEITGKQKGRAYACKPILDAIFERTAS